MAEAGPAFESPLPRPLPVPTAAPATPRAASDARVQLTDESAHTKYRVVAVATSNDYETYQLGRAVRTSAGLIFCVSPGEWTVHASPADPLPAAAPAVRAIDITHVRAAVRLAGAEVAQVLAKLCALDFSDLMFPDGAATRTLVASVATEVCREDRVGRCSYLLLASRSFGLFLYEALMDAGQEYGVSHLAATPQQ